MISNMSSRGASFAVEEKDSLKSRRLMELRVKIHDENYVNNAIQRIAQVISRRLVETPDEFIFRR